MLFECRAGSGIATMDRKDIQTLSASGGLKRERLGRRTRLPDFNWARLMSFGLGDGFELKDECGLAPAA